MENISIETLREILEEIKTKNIFGVRFTKALETNFSFEIGKRTKVDLENREYEGKYTVMVYSSWKILNKENKTLVTSQSYTQDKERVFRYFKALNNQIISHVEVSDSLTLSIYFTTGHCLEIFIDNLALDDFWWIRKGKEYYGVDGEKKITVE